jgi:hypothetical protein
MAAVRASCAAGIILALLIGSAAEHPPALIAASIPKELQGLQAITTWDVSEPGWRWLSYETCGIKDGDRYARVRLDHEVDSKLSNVAATRRIQALDRQVVRFLTNRGWSRIDLEPDTGGIPNVKRCYQKQGIVVQIYQTTGRCTMNTPCTAYDGFAVTIYSPRK